MPTYTMLIEKKHHFNALIIIFAVTKRNGSGNDHCPDTIKMSAVCPHTLLQYIKFDYIKQLCIGFSDS